MEPLGWKAPAAMLKLGLCYRQLTRPQDARTIWNQLVRDFPNSDEAKVAQQRLQRFRPLTLKLSEMISPRLLSDGATLLKQPD